MGQSKQQQDVHRKAKQRQREKQTARLEGGFLGNLPHAPVRQYEPDQEDIERVLQNIEKKPARVAALYNQFDPWGLYVYQPTPDFRQTVTFEATHQDSRKVVIGVDPQFNRTMYGRSVPDIPPTHLRPITLKEAGTEGILHRLGKPRVGTAKELLKAAGGDVRVLEDAMEDITVLLTIDVSGGPGIGVYGFRELPPLWLPPEEVDKIELPNYTWVWMRGDIEVEMIHQACLSAICNETIPIDVRRGLSINGLTLGWAHRGSVETAKKAYTLMVNEAIKARSGGHA